MKSTETKDAESALTSAQRELLRLDFAGRHKIGEICERLNISRGTYHRWKHYPEYKAAMRQLQERADRQILAEARRVRAAALNAARQGVEKISGMMGEVDTMHDAATGARAALDVYKTTAAQTGISERRTIEHEGAVSVNAEADSLVDELIGGD